MFTKIDEKKLESITGGVRPDADGRGCTQQGGKPIGRPRPTTNGLPNLAQ